MKKIILLLISAIFLSSLNYAMAQSDTGLGTMVTIECYRNNVAFPCGQNIPQNFSSSSTSNLLLTIFENVELVSQNPTSSTTTTTTTTTSVTTNSNDNIASTGGNIPLPSSGTSTTTTQALITTQTSASTTPTATSATSLSTATPAQPTGFFALSNSSVAIALVAIIIIAIGSLFALRGKINHIFSLHKHPKRKSTR